MKGILVTPVVSEPAFSGNSSRVAQVIAALAKLGVDLEVVLCPTAIISDRRAGSQMKDRYREKYHELNNGEVIRGRLYQRILNVAKKRLGAGRIRKVQDFMFEDGYVTSSVQKEFESLVKKFEPEFVIVEYAILSKLVDNLPSSITKIVDTHDRFAERNERIRASGGTGTWFSLSSAQEKKLLERFDHIIAIQEREGDCFTNLLDPLRSKVSVISILNGPFRSGYVAKVPNSIGFVGSNNRHNFEGIRLFLTNHWLSIRSRVNDATLLIAGADYPELHEWTEHGVEFLGRVDSLGGFYDKCGFVVNPCLSGTGLKIKSVEALSYCKPLITTPEGAEGIADSAGQGSVVHELSDKGFADKCVEMLVNRTLQNESGTLAGNYIQRHYEKSMRVLEAFLRN